MKITAARYAAVTSTLALLVALGGTSYAAVRIGTQQLKDNAVVSAKIKNNSVTGADVKDGSITGKDVDEYSLARVPNADTAVHAQSAGALDGQSVQTVHATQSNGAGRPSFVYRGAHLEVELRCDAGSLPVLVATTDAPGADITTVVVNDENPAELLERDVENGDFGPGFGDFDLLAGDDGDISHVSFTYSDADEVVQGTIVTDSDLNDAEPCKASGFVIASR